LYAIAKRLTTAPRSIVKELKELRRDFGFGVATILDAHKFGLAYKFVFFRTKSILHSKMLEAVLRGRRSFMRALQFDNDYRRGMINYTFPDSPLGNEMFAQRVKSLEDEYFETCLVSGGEGVHYYVSFSAYDPKANTFLIDPDVASDAAIGFVKEHRATIPRPRGLFFTRPFRFTQADFLLAQMQYWAGRETSVDWRRAALKSYGIELSKKAIWRREERLWQKRAMVPIIELRVPGFDEEVALSIRCAKEAREVFRIMPSTLPYTVIFTLDTGCLVLLQRPSHFATASRQLVHAVSRDPDVSDVEVYRFHWRVSPPWVLDMVRDWDQGKQRWNLEEGDI